MSNQITILAVDDDPILMDSIADILRNGGYTPLTAANGMSALYAMQSCVPDLIVADIMMPEMDGYQFCEAVRENPDWRAIPFIFLTARSTQDDIRRGYGLGADHYLTKPFEPDDLLLVIKSKLQRLTEIQEITRGEIEGTTSKLVSVFGNELQGPLSFIYNFISLLQEGRQSLGSETTDEVLNQMKKGVDELVRLVEDLMTIVYIDSGAMYLEIEKRRQSVDIGSAIQYAMRELSADAEQRGVETSMLIPSDLFVKGIPDSVHDIFTRVVSYSIRSARPADGHVWIEVERHEGQIVTLVNNDGIGIDPSGLTLLFSPLKDIDQHAITEQSTGLGIVIAERLTRLHGGSIRVDSAQDKGITLTITFPTID